MTLAERSPGGQRAVAFTATQEAGIALSTSAPAITVAPTRSVPYHVVKRAIDLLIGTVALVIALPAILILAILVRLDSPGPIVFRQQRLGKDARPFTFYKFRTMWMDARERYPHLYAYDYSPSELHTMYFKLLEDPRLTPLGRRLRKTSLDELPNLINVVRGEMSLVGPRPELPEMFRHYAHEQTIKFSVKPGVTGLAQVTGRAVLTFQQTIAADMTYCHTRGLLVDLTILLDTIRTVFLRVGAF